MHIGVFEIPEGLQFPRTHKQMRRDMRAFARSIGLELKFVRRKKSGSSYCNVINAEVTVVEKVGDNFFTIPDTIHTALHECAHWIDSNIGLFRKYYARWGYKHLIYPEEKDLVRLGVRAERHCNWQANRIMQAMYGRVHTGQGVYDNLESARLLLTIHYDLD